MKAAPAVAWLGLALFVAGGASPPPSPDIRPVRTIVVTPHVEGESVSLTGHIRARTEESLAFRIDGRMIARKVDVGAVVKPGDLVAELDPQPKQDALRSAQAALAAAVASLHETANNLERQRTLVGQGWSTRVQYDATEKAFLSAKAEVDSNTAQLHSAEDQLGYTKLLADLSGAVIATGAEAGEVVRAGQMIVTVAHNEGADAVFDVPASLFRQVSPDALISIALTDDPTVHTVGQVREVAPQADPVTNSYRVKVGLSDWPQAMRLGATVTGQTRMVAPGGIELPATALTMVDNKPAVWVVDRATQLVSLRPVELQRQDSSSIVVTRGLEGGELVVTAGVHALRPGQKVRLAERAMNRFNLSAWAIAHRSIVYFLMLAIVVVGIASYLRLGRNEDPTFTIKTMVVQAQWPGATLEDTLLQVTERIERKLQETPNLDYLKSYTKAGQSTVFVYLKGSTGPKAVTDTWYQVRKKVHDIEPTLPLGVPPPVCDDEFGDTYGIVYGFTADGFTHRELRDYVEDIRSRLLQVPDVAKVNLIGAQPERIYIQFSPAKLAGYGLTPTALTAALQAQNIVVPSGVITTDAEAIKLRVSGALRSEKDILAVNFAVGERIIRLADIAQVQREDADPPAPIFRINGKPGLGLAISMRDGGDVLALGSRHRADHAGAEGRPADRHRTDHGGEPAGDGQQIDQ